MEEYQQMSIFDVMYENYKITKPIRLIELFAGIGSQAKALKNIGANYEHYKVIENDKFAIASYNEIHNTNFPISDITKIHAEDLEIVETNKYEYILTYSFPCQDLSLAGMGKGMAKGSGTRSGLLWEVERILKECEELPQILLMENVPQVHNKRNIGDFKEWINFLERIGYSNFYQDLNANNYGIPQNRIRCFMVSILGKNNYSFPNSQEETIGLKKIIEEKVDKKYLLSEKIINELIIGANENSFLVKEATKKGYQEATEGDTINFGMHKSKTRRGRGGKQKAQTLTCSCEQAVIVRTLNNKHFLLFKDTKQLRETIEKNEFEENKPLNLDLYNRSTNNNSQTLTSPIHNSQRLFDGLYIRKFTSKEYWRLMGFSDIDHEKASKVNSNTQLYKQAGNSIVVNVLMEIFKQLF